MFPQDPHYTPNHPRKPPRTLTFIASSHPGEDQVSASPGHNRGWKLSHTSLLRATEHPHLLGNAREDALRRSRTIGHRLKFWMIDAEDVKEGAREM